MIHTTGEEWAAFLADPKAMPGDTLLEAVCMTVNGRERAIGHDPHTGFKARDAITLSGGTWWPDAQGQTAQPLEDVFKRWRRERGMVVVLVLVPAQQEQQLRASATRINGARVLS